VLITFVLPGHRRNKIPCRGKLQPKHEEARAGLQALPRICSRAGCVWFLVGRGAASHYISTQLPLGERVRATASTASAVFVAGNR
jgi:hypothetical protein